LLIRLGKSHVDVEFARIKCLIPGRLVVSNLILKPISHILTVEKYRIVMINKVKTMKTVCLLWRIPMISHLPVTPSLSSSADSVSKEQTEI